jgi:hypothetical protein
MLLDYGTDHQAAVIPRVDDRHGASGVRREPTRKGDLPIATARTAPVGEEHAGGVEALEAAVTIVEDKHRADGGHDAAATIGKPNADKVGACARSPSAFDLRVNVDPLSRHVKPL